MAEPQTSSGNEPLFNIGVVSRMTDIAEATLRVWERRYDFPRSARTAGGHRLYSQQDVLRLKWVKLRLDEGMQVSKAIQVLQRLEKEGEPLSGAVLLPLPIQRSSQANAPDDESMMVFSNRLLERLLAHDAEGAGHILTEVSSLFPVESILYSIFSRVFSEIGTAWETGTIDVATEHFATNLLRHHLLMWMRTGPPAFHVNPVLLACAPGELHEGSLLMLGVLLQRLRWPIVYLGQSVPLESLASFVEALEPSVIVFVAMMDETAHALAHWPEHLARVAQVGHPLVGYGGRAFTAQPGYGEKIPGVMLGKTLQEGIETLDRLLHELNPLLRS